MTRKRVTTNEKLKYGLNKDGSPIKPKSKLNIGKYSFTKTKAKDFKSSLQSQNELLKNYRA